MVAPARRSLPDPGNAELPFFRATDLDLVTERRRLVGDRGGDRLLDVLGWWRLLPYFADAGDNAEDRALLADHGTDRIPTKDHDHGTAYRSTVAGAGYFIRVFILVLIRFFDLFQKVDAIVELKGVSETCSILT